MTAPGVGTNRYSYSFSDPVNLRDPRVNCVWALCLGEIALAGAFLFTGGAVIYSAQDHNTPNIWSTPVAAPIPALPPSSQGGTLNLPNHTGNLNHPDVTDGRILADPVPVGLGGSMVSTPITPRQGVEVKSMAIPTDEDLRKNLAISETQMEILIAANPQLEQFKNKKIHMICAISYKDREQANEARLVLNMINKTKSNVFAKLTTAIISMTEDHEDSERYVCDILVRARPNAELMAQAEVLNSLGVHMFEGVYRGWQVDIRDKPSFRLTPSGIRPC